MKEKPSIIHTKDYPIVMTQEAGSELDQFLHQKKYSTIFILMDENIMKNCWPIISKESTQLKDAEVLVIEAGEEQKNIEIAVQLWQTLTEYQADRSSLLINFGGGMISDLGGFIASTYKRGIDFINIPTSLLAMADASIGGKTGINLDLYKNQIGTFNQPQMVIIQASFLETLEDRQLINGFGEMLKHGLIADSTYWKELLQLDQINAQSVIPYLERSILIKKNVVEQDPLEKAIRKSLNFGHTMGHIIETWSLQNDESPLLHGEAVAIGIILESYLSVKKTKLKWSEFEEIKKQISRFHTSYPIPENLILQFEEILIQDKKKSGKEFNFTFVNSIGQSVINQNCTLDEIKESLIYYKENC
ncbi:MAG: 3-dehydroquinate synthase [Bacteroidales bacterium]|nr:3-dehydroquinate synthase [Bacteroidales bacterium]